MRPEDHIEEAALRKYFREGRALDGALNQPAGAKTHGDLIDLFNVNGVLARYRILRDEPERVRLCALELPFEG